MPSPDLPPELDARAALLDAQPGPVQVAFQYCLALLMVEAGKAEVVATTPGDAGPLVSEGIDELAGLNPSWFSDAAAVVERHSLRSQRARGA